MVSHWREKPFERKSCMFLWTQNRQNVGVGSLVDLFIHALFVISYLPYSCAMLVTRLGYKDKEEMPPKFSSLICTVKEHYFWKLYKFSGKEFSVKYAFCFSLYS